MWAASHFEVRAETENASLRASFGGRARLLAGIFRSTRPSVRLEYGLSGMAWREKGTRREFLARNGKDPNMQATRLVLERSLSAFANGQEPPTSGAKARDVLAVVASHYGRNDSEFRGVILRYYLHALGESDALARHIRELAAGELARGTADERLSVKVQQPVLTRAWETARNAGVRSKTDMVKGAIIAAAEAE